MSTGMQMPGIERLGKIEVSQRAIASIGADAALRSYGVVGMASSRLKDGQVTIDLYVVVEYGTRISEVGRNIAQNVKFAVERAVGIPVLKVIVNVQGLRISDRS